MREIEGEKVLACDHVVSILALWYPWRRTKAAAPAATNPWGQCEEAKGVDAYKSEPADLVVTRAGHPVIARYPIEVSGCYILSTS